MRTGGFLYGLFSIYGFAMGYSAVRFEDHCNNCSILLGS